MALDKVVDSASLESGLTQIADAIRSKLITSTYTDSEWIPSQEGSGDPTLTNIRPIIARDHTYLNNKTIKLTFPEPIYGGSVSADGTGTKTWGLQILDGTEEWHKSSMAIRGYWVYPTIPMYTSTANAINEIVCDRYKSGTFDQYSSETNVISHDTAFCFAVEFETLAEWKAYLAEQYAAGTPVQVAYLLRTKESFTASIESQLMSFPNGFVSQIEKLSLVNSEENTSSETSTVDSDES